MFSKSVLLRNCFAKQRMVSTFYRASYSMSNVNKSTPTLIETPEPTATAPIGQAKLARRVQNEKEAELIKQIDSMETVAQQDAFTEKELQVMILAREAQLEEIHQETAIPSEALMFTLAMTLPMLGGSIFLYHQLAFAAAPILSYPNAFDSVLKLIGIHQFFQSGVHWGFAISQHDMQTDSVNSTKEVRRQFLLSCIPAVAALVNTMGMVYGMPTEGLLSLAPLSIIGGTQLFILGLDARSVESRLTPKWYLKLKLILSALLIATVGFIGAIYHNHGSQLNTLRLTAANPFIDYLPKSIEEIQIVKQKNEATAPKA